MDKNVDSENLGREQHEVREAGGEQHNCNYRYHRSEAFWRNIDLHSTKRRAYQHGGCKFPCSKMHEI